MNDDDLRFTPEQAIFWSWLISPYLRKADMGTSEMDTKRQQGKDGDNEESGDE